GPGGLRREVSLRAGARSSLDAHAGAGKPPSRGDYGHGGSERARLGGRASLARARERTNGARTIFALRPLPPAHPRGGARPPRTSGWLLPLPRLGPSRPH